jgi:hypothetical protein
MFHLRARSAFYIPTARAQPLRKRCHCVHGSIHAAKSLDPPSSQDLTAIPFVLVSNREINFPPDLIVVTSGNWPSDFSGSKSVAWRNMLHDH